MTYSIVEGTTGPIQFQLFDNGAGLSLAGCTVVLLLCDRKGTSVTPGTVSIINANTGIVQLVPASAATFVAANGPYFARWQVTDGSGEISFCPNTIRDVWQIVGQ